MQCHSTPQIKCCPAVNFTTNYKLTCAVSRHHRVLSCHWCWLVIVPGSWFPRSRYSHHWRCRASHQTPAPSPGPVTTAPWETRRNINNPWHLTAKMLGLLFEDLARQSHEQKMCPKNVPGDSRPLWVATKYKIPLMKNLFN